MPIGRLGRRGFGPQPFAAAAAVVELFDLFDQFGAFQQLLAAVEFDLMIPRRACFDVSCMTAQWWGDPAAGGCLSLVRCVQQGVVVGPWSWVKSSQHCGCRARKPAMAEGKQSTARCAMGALTQFFLTHLSLWATRHYFLVDFPRTHS